MEVIKKCFNVNSSSEIPPLQYSNDKGEPSFAYSSSEKVEVLNSYYSSISFIDDSNAKYLIFILYVTNQLMIYAF